MLCAIARLLTASPMQGDSDMSSDDVKTIRGETELLSAEDWAFIEGPLEAIPGWLNKITAAATVSLLLAQESVLSQGAFLEIGVYGGRYFSLLARHAGRRSAKVIGIDIFTSFSTDRVKEFIANALQRELAPIFKLQTGMSQNSTPRELESFAEGKYRFIHIDGSHEAEAVLADLELCDAVLGEGGIIAIDDFYSPYDAGVTQAFFKFQITRGEPLVAFAYVANKAFACRRAYAPHYRAALEGFLMHDRVSPASERFRQRLQGPGGRRMVCPKLFSEEMLVVV